MNTAFGMAIIISMVLHSVILAPLFNIVALKATQAPDSVVTVDYVTAAEPEMNVAVKQARPAEMPNTLVSKKAAMAANRNMAKNVKAAKTEARELEKEQAGLRASQGYINYYQQIRESIRHRLKNHYKNISAKGEVALIFILRADGALAAIDVDESRLAQNPALIRIAIASVKESSPFPPFPKELSVPKISFDLTISFKKE